MIYLFLFSSLFHTTVASVFHLRVSPLGLILPCRDPSGLVGNCVVDSTNDMGDAPVSSIQNLTPEDLLTVLFPQPPHLSITPRSEFAQIYPTVMLIPSPSLQLMTNVNDPAPFCLDGNIGTARFAYPIAFHAHIALLPNAHSINSDALMQTRDSVSSFFDLSTAAAKDVITGEVYDALIDEMEALSGSRNLEEVDFETIIPRLPNFVYTIYYNDNSNADTDVVARIILEPLDYLIRSTDGSYDLQVERAEDSSWTFGLNFLKAAGVFIDYENREIGFCEPM